MACTDKIIDISYADEYGDRWSMRFNLSEMCRLEGKKVDVGGNENSQKKVIAYPTSKVRSILKLFCLHITDDVTIVDIQDYLDQHSKKYGKLFHKIREKLNR